MSVPRFGRRYAAAFILVAAALSLVRQSGAQVAGIAVLIELTDLKGRARLGSYPFFTLIKY